MSLLVFFNPIMNSSMPSSKVISPSIFTLTEKKFLPSEFKHIFSNGIQGFLPLSSLSSTGLEAPGQHSAQHLT